MRKVFPTKEHVKDVEVGQMIGVGFPYIHCVYQVQIEGRLKFVYHYDKHFLENKI